MDSFSDGCRNDADGKVAWIDRRRRWTEEQKRRMVEETFQPGVTVSSVARKYKAPLASLFRWRRFHRQETGITVRGGEEGPVPAEVRQLLDQVKELQRFLGKLTAENENLRESARITQEKRVAV